MIALPYVAVMLLIFIGRFEWERSVLASSFVCFILALFLRQI